MKKKIKKAAAEDPAMDVNKANDEGDANAVQTDQGEANTMQTDKGDANAAQADAALKYGRRETPEGEKSVDTGGSRPNGKNGEPSGGRPSGDAESADGAPAPAIDGDGREPPESVRMLAELTDRITKLEGQSQEYLDRWKRNAAEFENYKRRTQNEMERLYVSSAAEVIAVFLPVVDSIERAVGQNCVASDAADPYREGLILIERQINDILRKLDVKPLPGVGGQFDPNLHEAVMHVADEAYGQNEIIEVFQKGYIYKDRVVRHSIVKVAN